MLGFLDPDLPRRGERERAQVERLTSIARGRFGEPPLPISRSSRAAFFVASHSSCESWISDQAAFPEIPLRRFVGISVPY